MSARGALPTGVALAATATPRIGTRVMLAAAAGLAYLAVRRLRGGRAPRGG